MKNTVFAVLAVLVGIAALLLLGEISVRAYYRLTYGPQPYRLTLDDKLGWRATGNIAYRDTKTDAAGRQYRAEVSTTKDGFRIAGDAGAKTGRKVLFVGDSFTFAADVSNGKTYYGLLKELFPIEVFAYGAGGYGTLQQYMILDQYFDMIRPDVVVLQLSSNDFVNNHYELERKSLRNNSGMRRPYMTVEGHVRYLTPKSFPRVRELINGHSRFLYFLANRLDRLGSTVSGSVEDIIEDKGESYEHFRESIEITDRLLARIRRRVPIGTLLLAFCVDAPSPYYETFRKLASRNGISFIDGVPQAVNEAETQGVVVRGADRTHWSEDGHRVAAAVLRKHLEIR